MKAYMLANLDDPISVQYTEIALESWAKQYILDIEVVQCYTPDTITDLEPLYNWKPLLHGMQRGENSSPSERAGDISHWQLLHKRAEGDARFYVMEHDSYLLDADEFERQFDFTMEHNLAYANHGLFMSCYSVSEDAAKYMTHLLLKRGFPLNGGPFGCMERLVKTYISDNPNDTKGFRWMCHHPNADHVNVGGSSEALRDTYNFYAKEKTPFTLASTQVISKSFGITQAHHGMDKQPWKRSPYFKIID